MTAMRITTPKLGWAACFLCVATLGCAAETSGDFAIELGETGGEDLGEVTQAISEGALDRPAAAAIYRRVGTDRQLWVFACDTNNTMRRRVGDGTAGGWADNWIHVAGSRSCASPPTAAKWTKPGLEGSEALFAYWRDLDNHLIEVRYNQDGTSQVNDLSSDLGLGTIVGTPAVADRADMVGATERISVAIRKSSNKLYTLDYYQGAWHVQPILTATTSIATGVGQTFGIAFGPRDNWDLGYGRPYISMQTSSTTHTIYSRALWSHNYTPYASITNSPGGVVTFLGRFEHAAPFSCLADWGCAMYRGSVGGVPVLKVASLFSGGDISGNFINVVSIGGSVWSGRTRDDHSFVRAANGKLAEFADWALKGANTPILTSAPAVTGDFEAFYTAGSLNRLWSNRGFFAGEQLDMGLDVLPP